MALGNAIKGAISRGVGSVTPSSVTGESHGGDKPEYPEGGEVQPGSYDSGGFDEQAVNELLSRNAARAARRMLPSTSPSSYGSVSSAQPTSLSQGSGMASPTIPRFGMMASSTGSDKPEVDGEIRPEVTTSDSGEWERQRAAAEGREVRTTNYFGEEYDDGYNQDYGLLNSLGFSGYTGYEGNTPQNDAYIRNAIESGLSDDEAWAIMNRDRSWLGSSGLGYDYSNDQEFARRGLGMDIYGDRMSAIDDGTKYDYAHMTSDWMTGPQYRRYVEMGMGGRPVDQIDPTQVYSKWDESQEYGFIPFVPDRYVDRGLAAGDATRIPGELGTRVANLRTTLAPDYSITYGPDGTTISGRDFDRLAGAFLNNYYYNIQRDPEYYYKDHGDSGDAMVAEYAIPNSEGGVTYAYGDIVDSGYDTVLTFSDGQQVDVTTREMETWDRDSQGLPMVPEEYFQEHGDLVDSRYGDTLYLTFSDGQTVGISPDYVRENTDQDGMIELNDLATMVPQSQASGNVPDDVSALGGTYYMPSLTMPDGTEIPLQDVERLYWDETAGDDPGEQDDDISYDLPMFSRPRRLMSQEPVEIDGGITFNAGPGELALDTIDWSLGSLPISVGKYLPWVYSLSQASSAMSGVNPSTYNPETGSYGLVAGGWDDDGNLRYGVQDANGEIDQDASDSTRTWSTLGNAAVPFTEMLVGPVGEQIIPLERLTGRLPIRSYLGRLGADYLAGAAAEGVEEDLGNVFEELMQYGPSGAFTNPVVGTDGQVVRDIYGHELRDVGNTTDWQRLANFANPSDLANAFLGGALVSAGPMGLPNTVARVPNAVMGDRARLQTGVDRYVETDLEREVREALEEGRVPNVPVPRSVSEAYASQFDDRDYRGDR